MELTSLSKQPSEDDQSLVRRFHPCDRHPDKAAFRSAEVASATGQSWLGWTGCLPGWDRVGRGRLV